uniref:Uncharacterized protein n=1 Tax=Morchella brunnea TaxID=1174671 RepID=A0A8K1I7Y3_9PEZI|nr:hypothetical protein LK370_mgp089 [Morchella brunnea]UBU98395.1 hypothetical protein [Morchella brunnea]
MTQNTIHSEGGGVVYNSSSLASRALRARTLPSLQFFTLSGASQKKNRREGRGPRGGAARPLAAPGRGAASKLLAEWSTTNTFWIYLIVISLIIFSLASRPPFSLFEREGGGWDLHLSLSSRERTQVFLGHL